MADYQDFQPAASSRERENIEWTMLYHYNAPDETSPRILLIGASTSFAFHKQVREELAHEANISIWASSKCVTDKDFFQELDMVLDFGKYEMIFFSNGSHSLTSCREEYDEAYGAALRFILAKQPESKLIIQTANPVYNEEKNAQIIALNDIAAAHAKESGLEIIDMFSLLDPLDRAENWRDEYHCTPEAVQLQGRFLVDFYRKHFSHDSVLEQQSTATGPTGFLA